MAAITSPLFQTAARAIRASAAREFEATEFGQLLKQVRKGSISPSVQRRLAALKTGNVRRMTRQFMNKPFGDTVRNLERYAKTGSQSRRLVDQFLGSLGPTGTLIRSLFGAGNGLEGSLRAASALIRAFGGEVMLPRGMEDVGDWDRGTSAAIERLQSLGYQVMPPEEEETGGVPKPRRARKTVDVPTPRGTRRVRRDDPAITGEMVTASSSNVHSYGYDHEHGYLYVRFLDSLPDGSRAGPGPLYRYAGVDVDEFRALHRAGSKGDWIWDHLRIRGTVSGHKKDYELVGIVRGYVPRKATLDPAYGGEAYIKRKVLTSKGRWLESQRPNSAAGGGVLISKAGTAGMPNRGAPNRGAPRTGRPAAVNRGR